MMENVSAPMYKLGNLQIIGWRGIQHALDCLCPNGNIQPVTLIAINAEKMLAIENSEEIKNLIKIAEFKYADGISIVRAIRKKFPNAQITRVAGADLWEAIMLLAGQNNTPVFLVGGKSEVLAWTEKKLSVYCKVNIVGSQDGYFALETRHELFERIRKSGAKIITVALGSPHQEIFMHDCRQVYPNALYMGVGGTYDVFTGYVKRAPKAWQHMGLEWLYRLLSQPSRITRQIKLLRYLGWYYTGKL